MSGMSLWLRPLRRYPRGAPWSKDGKCGCLSQLTQEPDSMARTADYSKQSCSIAATLEVVGDPWTLLIVREAFSGVRRFEDWQTRLGVARNVLAARLKTLVEHGVLERRRYTDRPPRFEYRLTSKGRDLYPVMTALTAWGDKDRKSTRLNSSHA